MSTLGPRAVVVHRHTELEELVDRHGTRQQAAFFLRTRGRSLEEAEARHDLQQAALKAVGDAIPLDWRRAGWSGVISTGSSSPPTTSWWPWARTDWWPTWPSTSKASR